MNRLTIRLDSAPILRGAMRSKLVSALKESVVRAKLDTLTKRVAEIQDGQKSGRLGPRVVRTRLRFVKAERMKLVGVMRRLGWEVD